MKAIPIKRISSSYTELNQVGQVSIRRIKDVLKGKDIVHDLHKHDFYLILALETGDGVHEIDFASYKLHNYSIFLLIWVIRRAIFSQSWVWLPTVCGMFSFLMLVP